jgi:hypothetical protein
MSAKQERAVDEKRWVPNTCECGSSGGAYLRHYEIMRCSCGKFLWALQPDRGGPFLMFPHPGFY